GAVARLETLFSHHNVVVLVGGSGLFVRAVCEGLDDLPKPLPGLRDRLNELYRQQGLAPLRAMLEKVDPDYFQEMDRQHPQRVIGALEVWESTGKPFSYFRGGDMMTRPFGVLRVGLDTDRDRLYERRNASADARTAPGC